MPAHSFVFKHWCTTLALASLAPAMIESSNHLSRGFFGSVQVYLVFLLFGTVLSLPALLLYYLLFLRLNHTTISAAGRKAILICFSVVCIGISFWFIKGALAPVLAATYAAAAIISGMLFRLDAYHHPELKHGTSAH